MSRLRVFIVASGIATLGVAGSAAAQTTPPPDDQNQVIVPPPTVKVETPAPSVQVQPAPTQVNVQPAPTQVNVQPAPAAATTPVVVPERPVNVSIIEDKPLRNFALSLGGGLSNFTSDKMQNRTDIAGAYEARLTIGTNSLIGAEAAYVGTAGGINALGLDDNAVLISNGVEGLARLNFGTGMVQPFVVGGASWVRYNVVNEDFNTSDVRSADDVLAVPLGGGIAGYLLDTDLMVEGRFIYRQTFDDELVRPTPTSSSGAKMNNWVATLRLGYRF